MFRSYFTGKPGYYLLVFAFALTWSSAFAAGKFALQVSPPAMFLGLRFITAAVILLTWAGLRGNLTAIKRDLWLRLLVLGLLNQACYNGLTWIGMMSVSSGLAAVIISTNPILIAILASLFLREQLTSRKFIGLIIGIIGVIIVLRNRIAITGEDIQGVLFVVFGLFSFVGGSILFKKWSPDVPLTVVVGTQSLSGGLALLLFGFWPRTQAQSYSAQRSGWR